MIPKTLVSLCYKGHELNNNIYIRPDNGKQECRTCRQEAGRKSALKRKIQRNYRPKTYCKYGHEYVLKNTGYDQRGHRYCNTCKRLKARKRINFKGFEYKTGFCKYGHKTEEHNYDRKDGYLACGICMAAAQRRRRDRKNKLDIHYSINDEKITRQIFNNRCFKCQSYDYLQIDHHYPLSRGYALSCHNAVLLCKFCNSSKGNKNPENFYSSQELCVLELVLNSNFVI